MAGIVRKRCNVLFSSTPGGSGAQAFALNSSSQIIKSQDKRNGSRDVVDWMGDRGVGRGGKGMGRRGELGKLESLSHHPL